MGELYQTILRAKDVEVRSGCVELIVEHVRACKMSRMFVKMSFFCMVLSKNGDKIIMTFLQIIRAYMRTSSVEQVTENSSHAWMCEYCRD